MIDRLIAELQKPEAYPHKTTSIKVVQTHISVVFLTGEFAYKICKPVKPSFLDFSTLEKRKHCCEQEVAFNSLLSPELYVGVTEIWENNNTLTVGGTQGTIIEYAIKMMQFSQNMILSRLLLRNKVPEHIIRELTQKIIEFHHHAPCSAEITQWGSWESTSQSWHDLFTTTFKYKPHLISDKNYTLIKTKIDTFLMRHKDLFAQRMAERKIKHCHGDLHPGNIALQGENILIFDGIVFNEQFSSCDVLSDLSFLLMDLEFYNKPQFSFLVEKEYFQHNPEDNIPDLLVFYKCHKAFVRGMVNGMMTDDKNIPLSKQTLAKRRSRRYFKLARMYAENL